MSDSALYSHKHVLQVEFKYLLINVFKKKTKKNTLCQSQRHRDDNVPLPNGLYCQNAKPNNSLDCKYFEVSMNKAFNTEQTLLEFNMFQLCSELLQFLNALTM